MKYAARTLAARAGVHGRGNARDGNRHWRERFVVHRHSVGSVASVAISGPGATGGDIRSGQCLVAQYSGSGRFLRLAECLARLRADGDLALDRIQPVGRDGQLPEFLNAGTCSWKLFSTLGVSPVLGRSFTPADDSSGAALTAILSWSLFERRFNHDPAVLGNTVRLNGQLYTIIGVLPEWFQYPNPKIQLWVPWQIDTPQAILLSHHDHIGYVVGRLKPGIRQRLPFRNSALFSTRSIFGSTARTGSAGCHFNPAAGGPGRRSEDAFVCTAGSGCVSSLHRVSQSLKSAGRKVGSSPAEKWRSAPLSEAAAFP